MLGLTHIIIFYLFEYTLFFSKILVVDIIWLLVSLALGVAAAVAEADAVKIADDFGYISLINKGSFASAAAFELVCMFVYTTHVAFFVIKKFTVNIAKK
jgi:hypothetical protein